jgi:hypothetical protein
MRSNTAVVCRSLRQQALAGVGQPLQPAEGQETAGALDGVDGAEDAAEQLARAGRPFERDKVLVKLIGILVAFNQELTDDLIHAFHP